MLELWIAPRGNRGRQLPQDVKTLAGWEDPNFQLFKRDRVGFLYPVRAHTLLLKGAVACFGLCVGIFINTRSILSR